MILNHLNTHLSLLIDHLSTKTLPVKRIFILHLYNYINLSKAGHILLDKSYEIVIF